jgi:hypothetical protein
MKPSAPPSIALQSASTSERGTAARALALFALVIAVESSAGRVQAGEISGARVNNMACDNFYFNIVAGPKTIRVQRFSVFAYHEEKTKYYVYYHPGEFAGTENEATQWTLVSTTEVKPTGHDSAFELNAGATFIEANTTGAFLITADLANDNGALWGGADGELQNTDVTVTTGRWLTRLNETTPKHFVTSGACSDSHGFGGKIVYDVVGGLEEGKTISGARVNNMACDNFYFNILAGPKTVRLDKFAVYAYHQEKTKYYVYFHTGDYAGTENDAAEWTLVSTTEVTPTGHNNAFELSAGGTFIEASGTGAFLITADLANDNGALWGGADGELQNSDLTITTGRWLTRLNETTPKHFVTSGSCSSSHGYGGVITYATILTTLPAKIVSQPPATLALIEGQELNLEVTVEGTGPFSYEWRKNGSAIPGATGAAYRKRAALGDGGDYAVVVTGAVPPPANSGVTKVTVQADTTPPAISAVASEGALTSLVVQFSELVDPVEAIKVNHYAISGGVLITQAELGETGDSVRLAVSRLQSFTEYTLTAAGIPDQSAQKNPLPAGSSKLFVTPPYYAYAPTTGSGSSWTQAYYTLTAGAKDLTVLSFDIVAFHDADTDYLLFTKPGDFAGAEFTAEAWTLVASNRLAFSIIPIPRPMGPLQVRVAAGAAQSFLIAHTTGNGTLYTGAGELVSDDFMLGLGRNYNRSGEGIFDGGEDAGERAFAGYIRYCLDVCQAPPSAPPVLAAALEPGAVRLTWNDPSFRLETSPALSPANWTGVPGSSPVEVLTTASGAFFRLVKP